MLSQLRGNLRVDRITERDFWPIYNVLRSVIKMIDGFLDE